MNKTRYDIILEWAKNHWLISILIILVIIINALLPMYTNIQSIMHSNDNADEVVANQTNNVFSYEKTDHALSVNENSDVNKFCIVNCKWPDLIYKVEKRTKFKHVNNADVNRIDLRYSGAINPISNSQYQYRYSGGNVIIYIDENICCEVNDSIGKIDLIDYSGSKEMIDQMILEDINEKVNNRIDFFANKIIQCIQN